MGRFLSTNNKMLLLRSMSSDDLDLYLHTFNAKHSTITQVFILHWRSRFFFEGCSFFCIMYQLLFYSVLTSTVPLLLLLKDITRTVYIRTVLYNCRWLYTGWGRWTNTATRYHLSLYLTSLRLLMCTVFLFFFLFRQ